MTKPHPHHVKAKWMAPVEPSVTLERYFEEPKTNCH